MPISTDIATITLNSASGDGLADSLPVNVNFSQERVQRSTCGT